MVNESPVDEWSLVHALNGLALGLCGVGPLVATGLAVVYEVGEFYHEKHGSEIFGTKRPESWANIAGDSVVYGIMFAAGRKFSGRKHAEVLGLGALASAAVVTWLISPLRATSAPDV